MSKWFKTITSEMREFIAEQKVFFVATAPHVGPHQPLAQGDGYLSGGG